MLCAGLAPHCEVAPEVRRPRVCRMRQPATARTKAVSRPRSLTNFRVACPPRVPRTASAAALARKGNAHDDAIKGKIRAVLLRMVF